MKKKEKRLSSRKRRALRRVLTAAAALFLANRIFLVGLLFPIQAVRRCEERENTGRTAVVYRDWDPEIYKTGLVYLTENEKVTLLSAVRLSLYGWVEVYGVPLDCTEPAPIHGGWWTLYRKGEPSRFYVFGRIDDPDIDRLNILWTIEGDGDSDMWVVSDSGEWMERDGRRYFLCSFGNANAAAYKFPLAVGCDAAGKEIARVELDHGVCTCQ